MSRRLLAVLLSSAWFWTAIAVGASAAPAPANPPASTRESTASTPNQPPLPPGRAVDIRKAQGLEDDDLGPGVIIAGIVGATAALFLLLFSDGDDDDSTTPTTGSN